MTNDALTVFVAPGACSRVVLVALEKTGASYTVRPVLLARGEQHHEAFLAFNPKGKIPLLLTQNGTLSESVAILTWLDGRFPQAALLPPAGDAWARAQAMSWLAWSASTLHPLVYRVRMTARIHPGTATHEAIRDAALEEMSQQLAVAENALADGRDWLMGSTWCIADTYLCWAFGRGVDSGLDVSAFPCLCALVRRQAKQPAFQRALSRESTSTEL
jgi:glutathione S-transferase